MIAWPPGHRVAHALYLKGYTRQAVRLVIPRDWRSALTLFCREITRTYIGLVMTCY